MATAIIQYWIPALREHLARILPALRGQMVRRVTHDKHATERLYTGLVVSAGAVAIGVAALRAQPLGRMAAIFTVLLVIELTIRFRYVIALLAWPPTLTRLGLLTAFWAALVNMAWQVPDNARWAGAAVTLFIVGIAIEVHNLVTGQWEIGDATMQRSLRNDILRGIASAAVAAVATVAVARWRVDWMPAFIAALVVADAIRLAEMVLRHRRLTTDNAVEPRLFR